MKEKMEAKLEELKTEFEAGQKMLEEIDIKRSNLGQTILRISGAIQALQELIPEETEEVNSENTNI
jgi:predicted nuclease with TOPRIM domain